ncbi:acyltransferase [Leptospira ognonensis]|uniref:Acyltransferase n=1 Tax=Leptospira ognonensis TaxID=2484945 RepID=A0A4R9JZP7_9LEPT|nr:acyltransferase [Leptospira ognonensis]TGL57219.1 acyltransferase [Leptospira ognonensis]
MKEYFLEIFRVNPKEINELYGIRAIGCYIVIAYHCFVNGLGFMPAYFRDYHSAFQNFEFLMDLFFVISSFLVSYAFSNELKKSNFLSAWKNFFFKRSLRIFPPLYLLISFSIIIMGLTLQAAKQGANLGVMTSGLGELEMKLSNWWVDVFYISNYFPVRMLIHGWSLSMEEQFYIAMPVFFLFYTTYIKRTKWKFLFLLGFLVLPIAVRTYYYFLIPMDSNEIYVQKIFHPIHTHFDSFIAGILLMEIFRLHKDSMLNVKFKKWFYLLFIPSTLLLIYSFTFKYESLKFYQTVFRISEFTLFSFLLVLGTVLGYFSYFKTMLTNILIVSVGKLSYGIYLVHLYVSGFVMIKVYSYTDIQSNDSISVLKSSIYTLGISTILALLSYYFVEKPFLKIREWSQPRFDVQTHTFYRIPINNSELRIVSWILTALSFVPFFIFKQFIKINFVEKSFLSSSILFLLITLPILFNLFTLITKRSLGFTWLFHAKFSVTSKQA